MAHSECKNPPLLDLNPDLIKFTTIRGNVRGLTIYEVLMTKHPPTWSEFFKSAEPEIRHACRLVEEHSNRTGKAVYPLPKDILNAFWATPFPLIRAVILGQDPYPGQDNFGMPKAVGMSFSTRRETREIPASLETIYKELERSVEDWKKPNHGDLCCWARQGVFLLNTALTVEANSPGCHTGFWKPFTEKLMSYLNVKCKNIVFMLWGRHAQTAAETIYSSKHTKLEAYHPSPNNAGKIGREFANCDHFNKCNLILLEKGIKCIDWRIT